MEETKEKETKEKIKLSTIRIVVISETCLLIIKHEKGYASRSVGILFLLYFAFVLKMSVAG